MNVDALRGKLENLQQKKTKPSSEKKDYSLVFWKPTVGKHTIRIVPSATDPENPFTELKFYYNVGGFKSILSPLNYGEKDPIAELAKKLRANYSAENFKLAKTLDPKTRIFVPVIVRGEEEKGVRLWQFGKQIYEELLSLATDEEVGDYTDIMTGRDFTVEVVGKEATGTEYDKTTIRPKMKTSPIGTDKKEVKKWLEEQPVAIDQYNKFTFEEIKSALAKWLTPEEEDESTFVTEEDENNTQPPVNKFKLDTSTSKQTKENKFNALFSGEDDEETSELPLEDDEDLPINKPVRKK